MRRWKWTEEAVQWLEKGDRVDAMSSVVGTIAGPFNQPPLVEPLRGAWLGHAFHPMMTDIPLGCWTGAIVLDMMPGRESASCSLVGAGLVMVPLTVAAGLSEWDNLDRPEERRVAAVHAVGNVAAAAAFAMSWSARRSGRQTRGVLWSLLGGTIAMGTGYLGGHLSLVQRVGTGYRG